MKKLTTLHVLNGDASVPAFKLADLPGQLLIWREILASGPVARSVPDHTFWQMRQHYITNTFEEPAGSYQAKVLSELPKLESAGHFFEVVLWFDTDLVCQVNLLYILQALYKQNPAVVSVCTSSSGYINFKKIEEIQNLFERRVMLTREQLQQAWELWQLYAGHDPIALQTYLNERDIYSAELKNALELHLKRFPDQISYLGYPQTLLLSAVAKGATTQADVQQKFWQQDPGYGFGDWQLQIMIQELVPELLILDGEQVTLTDKGKQVLERRAVYTKDHTYWLGGTQLNQQDPGWCRDPETGKIKKCGAKAEIA